MQVLTEVTLALVRQTGNWEACAGCPAMQPNHTPNSLCSFLSRQANERMGGFASCGGGATWNVVNEKGGV